MVWTALSVDRNHCHLLLWSRSLRTRNCGASLRSQVDSVLGMKRCEPRPLRYRVEARPVVHQAGERERLHCKKSAKKERRRYSTRYDRATTEYPHACVSTRRAHRTRWQISALHQRTQQAGGHEGELGIPNSGHDTQRSANSGQNTQGYE